MDRRTVLRSLAVLAAAACTPDRTTTPTAGPRSSPPAAEAPSSAAPSASPTEAPPSASLDLVCRDAWGARPATGDMRPHAITRVTVHHSAARLDEVSRGPAQLRNHQAFHLDGNGWADLAYHVSIDRGGVLYMGRRWDRAGDTNTDYDPAGHFLVLLDGNFDEQDPSNEQIATATRTLAWAAEHFGVGLDTVSGHRDHAATSCPGDRLYARLPGLVAAAQGLAATGAVALADWCGPDAAAFVADVEAGRT